jgi:predicted ATPase/DNA-binding winged helix-turn-helix (wHTH) protein
VLYAFGDVELDDRLFILRRGGTTIRVQPKVFDLLLFLVKAGDRVVLKDELMDALWPGLSVGLASLTRVVVEGRRAIGDEDQRLIETVRGRGFRLAVPVTVAVATPPSAPPETAAPLVGRAGCLEAIATRLARARAGTGGVVLLTGERGIGKSRVVAEAGRRAEAAGFAVSSAYGRDPASAPPLSLWSEALPDLPELAQPPDAATRFTAFREIARRLADAAKERPLLLLFDDLHAADADSLQLLEFLAPALGRSRVLVVGSYWDAAILGDARGRALIGAMGSAGTTVIALRPLSLDDLVELVETARGARPPAGFAAALLERSGGNPLYATQVLSTEWARRSLDGAVPSTMDLRPELIGAISLHLEALSAGAREIVTLAAVLGPLLDVATLRVVSGLPSAELLARLDEALRGQVLRRSKDGQLKFAHALVRDVLYKRLSSVERARHHAMVAERMLAHHGSGAERHLPEIAGHLGLALPEGDVERAVDIAMRAAALEADRPLAAARYWQIAERALALLPGGDPRQIEVARGLARAWQAAGRDPQAADALRTAELLERAFRRPP